MDFEYFMFQVSQHCELMWMLSTLTTMPRLQHLPQWKVSGKSHIHKQFHKLQFSLNQNAELYVEERWQDFDQCSKLLKALHFYPFFLSDKY